MKEKELFEEAISSTKHEAKLGLEPFVELAISKSIFPNFISRL